jgi:hypothetical protein
MHPIDIPLQAAHLWLRAADVGVRAAILPVQLSARAASAVLDRMPTGAPPAPPASEPVPAPAPRPAPAQVTDEPPVTVKAKAPVKSTAQAAAKAAPKAAPKAKGKAAPKAKAKAPSRSEVRPEPATGHAEVRVAEPWEGYAALSAAEVVDRLADADETVRAAVRLYEDANESREAVLHATEG